MSWSVRILGNQEETRQKRREDHHVLYQQFRFLVAITQQQVTPSTRHDPAWSSSVLTDEEIKDTCYIYPNISQKVRGDDDAVLVRQGSTFFAEKEARRDFIAGTKPFLVLTDAGKTLTPKTRQGELTIPNPSDITMCSRISQKDSEL